MLQKFNSRAKLTFLALRAYKEKLVDEYTDNILHAIAKGHAVNIIVNESYSIGGLRVLAEIKGICPDLLTIYAINEAKMPENKNYTSAKIGNNLFFANKGGIYDYDVAKVIENCDENNIARFDDIFAERKKQAVELKTKEEICEFAKAIEDKLISEKYYTRELSECTR